MLSEKLVKELNVQLGRELQSAYLYLSMAAYCRSVNMSGSEKWMQLQAQEEMGHAMKLYNFISDRNSRVILQPLPQPKTEFKSLQEVFELALANEEDLDRLLNNLSTVALAEKDNTTYSFLEWFLTEQVEEVATCTGILDKLKLIGDNGYGILMLDEDLGRRQSNETAE